MYLPHSRRIARGAGEDPSRHLLDAVPLQRDNRTTLNSIASITPHVKTTNHAKHVCAARLTSSLVNHRSNLTALCHRAGTRKIASHARGDVKSSCTLCGWLTQGEWSNGSAQTKSREQCSRLAMCSDCGARSAPAGARLATRWAGYAGPRETVRRRATLEQKRVSWLSPSAISHTSQAKRYVACSCKDTYPHAAGAPPAARSTASAKSLSKSNRNCI